MKSEKTFNEKMNSITKNSIFLCCVALLGSIVFGIVSENGDMNSGSNYGLLIMPFFPIIIIALGMIEFLKAQFPKSGMIVILSPCIFLLAILWLDDFYASLLVSVVGLVLIYVSLKSLCGGKKM